MINTDLQRVFLGGVLLLLLSPDILFAQDKDEDKKAKAERYAKEWRKYIDAQNGNIIVSGEVVSSTGEALEGVGVDIDRSIAAGWEDKSVTSRETVGKSFKLEFKDCQGVCLDFSLPGYHREQLEFRFGKPQKATRVQGKTFYYENVRVMLDKIGELARLDEYDLWLKLTPDGKATVWDISKVNAKKGKTVLKEIQMQGDAPPAGTVYACLVPSATETKPVIIAERVISPPNNTVVRIGLNDGVRGGFICVSVERKHPNFMRQLKTAPEDGYKPFFDLTNDDLVRFRHLEPICFYVKLNGLYGKGKLWSVDYTPEEGLEIRIRFRIQPNGTRNLETTG